MSRDTYPRRRTVLKGIAGGAAFGLAGCSQDGDGGTPDDSSTDGSTVTTSSDDSFVIGLPAALTGNFSYQQGVVNEAIDMAIQEVNDTGGPLGNQVKSVRRDTGVNPQNAQNVVQQMINNDNAIAIGGLFSSEVTALQEQFIDWEVPVVSTWGGTTALDTFGGDHDTPDDLSDDEWVWRTVISDSIPTAGAARVALDNDYDKIGVLNGTSQGERSWSDAFISAYENGGGTISQRVEAEEGKTNYQSEIDRLFQADFDAWLLALTLNDAVTVIRQWNNGGYGKQLLLENSLLDNNLIEQAGGVAEGALAAASAGAGPNYDSFKSRYQERSDETLNSFAPAGYDMVNVISLAIQRAGEASSEAIQKNLGPVTRGDGTQVGTFEEGKEALDNGDEISYQGSGTECRFTGYGNVYGAVSVEEVTPDGFNSVQTIEASALSDVLQEY